MGRAVESEVRRGGRGCDGHRTLPRSRL